MDISKALKCSICNKYIISYEDLYNYNTCSEECEKIAHYKITNQKEKLYQHLYYLKVTKIKRKRKYQDKKEKING